MPFEQALFVHAPRYLPWAEYAIVSCHQGVIGVDLRRVPVDIEAVRLPATSSGLPDASDWIKNWLLPGDLI